MSGKRGSQRRRPWFMDYREAWEVHTLSAFGEAGGKVSVMTDSALTKRGQRSVKEV